MRNKLLIGILAASAALALACGSGTDVSAGDGSTEKVADAKKRTPVAVAVGQPINVTADSLTAKYTLSKSEIRTEDKYGDSPEGGVYLLAFLRVDVTKGETFACACELSLVQKDGRVREQSYGSFSNRPEFESADLKAGQNTDGWVMWTVPKKEIKTAQVQLKVSSLFEDSAYGYWRLG